MLLLTVVTERLRGEELREFRGGDEEKVMGEQELFSSLL